MTYIEKLRARWLDTNSLLCVGLDPNPARFPAPLMGADNALYDFCIGIVEATAPWVCAFKPQIAYFASMAGEEALQAIIRYIHHYHPTIPVILDAKRGDIGSTAEHYAKEAFDRYQADCVTVSPYMGHDTLLPYLDYQDKGVYVLCRTSNPGGDDFQMLDVGGEKLFERIARLAESQWNTNGSLGLVVGATYPQELATVRRLAPSLNLLVPGIGAQGGDITQAVAAGLDAQGLGMVINSGRAILYASADDDWAQAAGAAAKETCEKIRAAQQNAR